jgi:glycosyltransferase involved in cell wall biosynthesis
MRISAIIPTFNREIYIEKALQSLVQQSMRPEEYEIILVDNCSTDRTKDIVREKFPNVPNLRYIYEPKAGLNHARNCGWTHAKGKYVAFLDDDAIASPHWLEKIVEVFETVVPLPGCVGGEVEAIWEAPRPVWLSNSMLSLLTILSWGESPKFLQAPQFLAGANFAFTKDLLEEVGGFVAGLDRIGNKMLSNGDVMIERAVEKQGFLCYYHPQISVRHHIPATRLTQKWFLNRFYWQGISDAVMENQLNRSGGFKITFKFFRLIPGLIIPPRRYTTFLTGMHRRTDFEFKCSTYGRVGYMWGLLRSIQRVK